MIKLEEMKVYVVKHLVQDDDTFWQSTVKAFVSETSAMNLVISLIERIKNFEDVSSIVPDAPPIDEDDTKYFCVNVKDLDRNPETFESLKYFDDGNTEYYFEIVELEVEE